MNEWEALLWYFINVYRFNSWINYQNCVDRWMNSLVQVSPNWRQWLRRTSDKQNISSCDFLFLLTGACTVFTLLCVWQGPINRWWALAIGFGCSKCCWCVCQEFEFYLLCLSCMSELLDFLQLERFADSTAVHVQTLPVVWWNGFELKS